MADGLLARSEARRWACAVEFRDDWWMKGEPATAGVRDDRWMRERPETVEFRDVRWMMAEPTTVELRDG